MLQVNPQVYPVLSEVGFGLTVAELLIVCPLLHALAEMKNAIKASADKNAILVFAI